MNAKSQNNLTLLIMFIIAACLYIASVFVGRNAFIPVSPNPLYTVIMQVLSVVPYLILVIHGIMVCADKTKIFFFIYFIYSAVVAVGRMVNLAVIMLATTSSEYVVTFGYTAQVFCAYGVISLLLYIPILVQHFSNNSRRILSRISLIILMVLNTVYDFIATLIHLQNYGTGYVEEVFTTEFVFNSLIVSFLPKSAFILAMIGCLIYTVNEARVNQTLQKES